MLLPDLRKFDLTGKKVLVRVDFDVPLSEDGGVADDSRIQNALPTIHSLLAQKATVNLLSHLGRPNGQPDEHFSLKPVITKLQELLPEATVELADLKQPRPPAEIVVYENLRFFPGEEDNDFDFAQKLAALGDFYVNDAFAVAHRDHASVVSLPGLLPHAAGLSLLKEVEVLTSLLENPKRPVVLLLGGAKEDKLEKLNQLMVWADKVLVGGQLPMIISNLKFEILNSPKVTVAGLNEAGKDITLEAVEEFGKILTTAGTIVWAGPLGLYEEEAFASGTKKIAELVTGSQAYTIIGGGDTEAALTQFGLVEKIDFVSAGGGAMLEFLAEGDLPGLKALRIKND